MSLNIEIIEVKDERELQTLIASGNFNAPFVEYERDVLEMVRAPLTESELSEFEAWWTSKMEPGFWDKVTEPAYHAIMRAISYGLG